MSVTSILSSQVAQWKTLVLLHWIQCALFALSVLHFTLVSMLTASATVQMLDMGMLGGVVVVVVGGGEYRG